jgi:hypothetical protein
MVYLMEHLPHWACPDCDYENGHHCDACLGEVAYRAKPVDLLPCAMVLVLIVMIICAALNG